MATISLNYRKRALPMVWMAVPFGGAELASYVELVRSCVKLVPDTVQVILHGDTEFGGADMIRALREIGWDFILAQAAHIHFRPITAVASQPLSRLPVSRHHPCQVSNVDLFAHERLGAINLFAFYDPHHRPGSAHQRDICYLAASLPLAASLRRIGHRRWGTEPFYRDYKSAGWHITDARLQHPTRQAGLLVLLAIVYLWSVCFGRWLGKTGQRHLVDAKPRRHLSLFRLGWDWLIHQLRCDYPCPVRLRLYS